MKALNIKLLVSLFIFTNGLKAVVVEKDLAKKLKLTQGPLHKHLDQIKKDIHEKVEEGKAKVNDIIEKIKEGLKSKGYELSSAAHNLLNKAGERAKQALDTAKGRIETAVERAKRGIHGFLTKAGTKVKKSEEKHQLEDIAKKTNESKEKTSEEIKTTAPVEIPESVATTLTEALPTAAK